MLVGYLWAALLFVPAALLYVARAKPRTVVIYTLVLGLALLLLPSVMPIDLPTGMLG